MLDSGFTAWCHDVHMASRACNASVCNVTICLTCFPGLIKKSITKKSGNPVFISEKCKTEYTDSIKKLLVTAISGSCVAVQNIHIYTKLCKLYNIKHIVYMECLVTLNVKKYCPLLVALLKYHQFFLQIKLWSILKYKKKLTPQTN